MYGHESVVLAESKIAFKGIYDDYLRDVDVDDFLNDFDKGRPITIIKSKTIKILIDNCTPFEYYNPVINVSEKHKEVNLSIGKYVVLFDITESDDLEIHIV